MACAGQVLSELLPKDKFNFPYLDNLKEKLSNFLEAGIRLWLAC